MSLIEQPPPPSVLAGSRRRDLAFRFAPRYRVVWIALTALVILCLATGPEVFHTDSLTLVTALAGVLAIASAGQLLVIMAGGIDLSVPAVMTLAAGVVVHQTNALDGRLAGAIVEVIAITGAIGLINGLLVAVLRLNAMIVTLAMSGAVTGVTLLWMGTSFSNSGNVPPALAKLCERHAGFLSLLAIIAVVLIVLLAVTLRSTRLGRNYVAAGTNRTAAEIIGIRVVYYEVGGYVLAGVLYGVAGLFLAGLLTSPDSTVGQAYQLTTIIAVALGGAALAGGPASLLCTMGGCLFLSLLAQYLQSQNYSGGVSEITNGVVLVVAVAMVTAGSGGRLRLRARGGRLGALLLRRPGRHSSAP
jgi:ribose transport system permease protein